MISISRPLRSTLFPYTTLFRSPFKPTIHPTKNQEQRTKNKEPRTNPNLSVCCWLGPALRSADELAAALTRHLRDRKSTRLNSSHLVISYDVYCLKKKNKPMKKN